MILDDKLKAREPIVLDGAVSTEIIRLGGERSPSAWSGVANKSTPEVVRRVHEEYIRAGVDVITTNTFRTSRHSLAGAGLADEAPQITARAVELAREAIENVAPDRPVAIAGSMSHDVSWIPGTVSPDPRFLPTPEEEADNYREMAEALANAGVDLILLEMMADIKRARWVATAAAETGLPIWMGLSCSLFPDGTVANWNYHLEESVESLDADHPKDGMIRFSSVIDAMLAFEPQVMGVMHTKVDTIGSGVEALFEKWSGPVMAYPETNAGRDVEPIEFSALCRELVEGGVQIIGGCCGTTIEHIRAMVAATPEAVGSSRA